MSNDSKDIKEALEPFTVYSPPKLLSLDFKVWVIANKVGLYDVEYSKSVLGVPYTNKEVALIFGTPPNPGEQLLFDLLEMYLPIKQGLQMVDMAALDGNLGSEQKVNVDDYLLSFPNGVSDVVIPCCVNWRNEALPSLVHPCMNTLISTDAIDGGGKSICTFSISYEDNAIGIPDSSSLPLAFFAGRQLFYNGTAPSKVGERFINYYGDENHLFGSDFDGMFLLPMVLPGNSGVVHYAFPNRRNQFKWPAGSTGRDPNQTARFRLESWFSKLNAVRTNGRLVLGIDENSAHLLVEEWSMQISLQGMFLPDQ